MVKNVSITMKSVFEIQFDTDEQVVLSGYIGRLLMRYGDDVRQNSYTIDGRITPTAEIEGFLFNCFGKKILWKLTPGDGTSGPLNGNGFIRLERISGRHIQLSIHGTGPIEGISD